MRAHGTDSLQRLPSDRKTPYPRLAIRVMKRATHGTANKVRALNGVLRRTLKPAPNKSNRNIYVRG
jgi:hypothetical protein